MPRRAGAWWQPRAKGGNAFVDGLHVALLIGAATAVLAAMAVAVLLPRRAADKS